MFRAKDQFYQELPLRAHPLRRLDAGEAEAHGQDFREERSADQWVSVDLGHGADLEAVMQARLEAYCRETAPVQEQT